MPVFELWATQRCVFLVQHAAIVLIHPLILDPVLGLFVLFMRRKRVVGIFSRICLEETLSVLCPWLSNGIA